MSRLSAHVTTEPEAADRKTLERSAGADVTLTYGDGPVPESCTTLVEGVPSAERLDAAPQVGTLIIPWSGLPVVTRDVVLFRPLLRVHNLHHNAAPTAELAIALYLAAAKRIVPRDQELRRGDWSQRDRHDLAQLAERRRALVWGAGAVGQRVAEIAGALGMEVTMVRRAASGDARGAEELDGLLPTTDVLFACVPLTAETEGRIGAEQLGALPEGAVLVNVARGPVVQEEALFRALERGHLFGAGLDVWWQYPRRGTSAAFPAQRPFAALDNVVLSPHRGGHVRETEVLRMEALGRSLRCQAAGEKVPWPVDVERGY